MHFLLHERHATHDLYTSLSWNPCQTRRIYNIVAGYVIQLLLVLCILCVQFYVYSMYIEYINIYICIFSYLCSSTFYVLYGRETKCVSRSALTESCGFFSFQFLIQFRSVPRLPSRPVAVSHSILITLRKRRFWFQVSVWWWASKSEFYSLYLLA